MSKDIRIKVVPVAEPNATGKWVRVTITDDQAAVIADMPRSFNEATAKLQKVNPAPDTFIVAYEWVEWNPGVSYVPAEADNEKLIEDGVGLIAKGLFRIGSETKGNDPREAYEVGSAAASTIRGIAMDFFKIATKREKEAVK